MRLGIIQTDIVWNEPEQNARRITELAERAVEQGADTLVIPEMFTTGFSLPTGELALDGNRVGLAALADLSTRLHVSIIGSLPEVAEAHHYNTAYVVTEEGILGQYRKIHLFSFGDEQKKYSPGSDTSTFLVNGMRVTPFICYDLRFPHIFAETARKTDLFVVVANWPAPRREHWLTLLRARAVENQAYVVGVNRVGEGGGLSYSGDSVAYAPDGQTIAHLGTEPGFVCIDMSSDEVGNARSNFPTLRDRRDDLYSRNRDPGSTTK